MKYYTESELYGLFVREITTIYNDFAERIGENQVGSFRNKKVAVTRTMEVQGRAKNHELKSRYTPTLNRINPETLVTIGDTNFVFKSAIVNSCLGYEYPMQVGKLAQLLYAKKDLCIVSQSAALAIIGYYVSTRFLEVVK